MPQLDFSNFASQIFWLLLTFGILYLALKSFIIPKIEVVKSLRGKLIDDNIELSKKLSQEIIDTKSKYEQLLKVLEDDFNSLKQSSAQEFEAYKITQSESLNNELSNIESQLKNEIAHIQAEVDKNYQQSCCALANVIVERITSKPAEMDKLNKIYQDNYS